ncbi:hypothetical protein BP6252_14126 [Coleophoma cylindrospora]|uniref:Cytochrome P450 n=1 Tax=Coleophoma cylindrospora TaxID=1849047 RepID=A0A3D8Q3U9_9HELO|nr:hypothetical protein BP6252_14126 [Coleophoma cylindrospora]
MSLLSEAAKLEIWRNLTLTQWAVLVTLFHVLYKLVLYPFLLSPVRHVPGPWYTRMSRIPLQYAIYQHRRTSFATALLDQYGAIVVIAPDQVHTNDESAMKIIYDRSSLKTSFYKSMGSWKGVTGTLGFIDYKTAAPTRNNLIECFQNRNLATLVANIESHIHNFIRLLDENADQNEKVDGVIVFRLLALDIVTDVLWGEETRLLANINHLNAQAFLRRFLAFSRWNATKSFIPGADTFVRFFGTKKWRELRNDCNDMDITARDALQHWRDNKDGRHEKDVLSMLQAMNNGDDQTKIIPSDDHIIAYMVEMLAAGSSTTSHTAAFVCWMLMRNADAQKKLHSELLASFPDLASMDIKLTMDLPYLDAVIRETMRLFPMIPGPLERILGKEIVVDGYVIPPGVMASTAAYNQGQLEDVFPDAKKWNPDRWLDANDRMRLNWIPFGHGCRACPGVNLAMTELKYIIGAVFRRFRVVIPPGHEDDILEFADVFAAGSKTGHCWLKFDRLEQRVE